MAIGGYTTAILSHDHHWNLLATLPVAFLVGFVFGVVVGLPALRFHGVYLALATFALARLGAAAAAEVVEVDGRQQRHRDRDDAGELLAVLDGWACAGIAFVAAWLLLRGRTGRAFRAIRDSEVAAVSSGVSLPIYKTFAFGVSAAYAGVAGSLYVLVTNGFASPGVFGARLSLQLLIGAAVAGLGSLWGIVVGRALRRPAARSAANRRHIGSRRRTSSSA